MIWQILKWLTFGELMEPRVERERPEPKHDPDDWIFGDGGVISEDESDED